MSRRKDKSEKDCYEEIRDLKKTNKSLQRKIARLRKTESSEAVGFDDDLGDIDADQPVNVAPPKKATTRNICDKPGCQSSDTREWDLQVGRELRTYVTCDTCHTCRKIRSVKV